jgi:hypothetical protein
LARRRRSCSRRRARGWGSSRGRTVDMRPRILATRTGALRVKLRA